MANMARVQLGVAVRCKVARKREASRVLSNAPRLRADVDFPDW